MLHENGVSKWKIAQQFKIQHTLKLLETKFFVRS